MKLVFSKEPFNRVTSASRAYRGVIREAPDVAQVWAGLRKGRKSPNEWSWELPRGEAGAGPVARARGGVLIYSKRARRHWRVLSVSSRTVT